MSSTWVPGSPLLGIDLGTTNTVGAVGGRSLDLSSGLDAPVILPSVVAYPPSGAVLVGAAAKRRRVIDAENTIFSSKRVIGRAWNSEEAQEFRKRYPFAMECGQDGTVHFRTRGGLFSAVDIAATVVGALLRNISSGQKDRCVVGVPASFQEPQRLATAAAVKQAGVAQVAVVEEPVAAAHAYAGRWSGGLAAVYDLGGGTFDFTVLDCSNGGFKVLAHDGDPFLGGDDVDHALAMWAAQEVLKKYRVDLSVDREAMDRLVLECEQAKIRLSYVQHTHIDLGQVDPVMLPPDGRVDVDQPQLQRLVADLVRRSFVVCEDVLRRGGVDRKKLGAVFLAGGSTQLPVVRTALEHFFGRSPHVDISPTQVVSMGASLAGAALLKG